MSSNKDQATIKLCVIAALADGEVSPQELGQAAALYASQQLIQKVIRALPSPS